MTAKKILIIDDEKIIRVSLQQDLQDEGYEVDTAEDGQTAIKMFDRGYELIITDLMMEGLDGIAVLKKAREINPHQAVFILTGYGELESAITALRLGAADYLLKPYNFEELLLRIKNCLEKQELQKKIKLYENILPICSVCKKVRDDEGKVFGQGDWKPLEEYLKLKADMDVSHSMCLECSDKLYSGQAWYEKNRNKIIGEKK